MIDQPGDEYEREADRIAGMMAAPAHYALGGAPPRIQRFGGRLAGQMDVAPASLLRALASPGRSLEPALRQDMEQRFGHDFSRVRVHTGALAEQSARDVMARAYTVGYDIVFGPGRFAPGTQEGRRLIAHELTHVVQQSGADGKSVGQNNENRGGSAISRPVTEGHAVALSVQRAPVPPAEIEMPADPARPLEPGAELAKFTAQSTYIDNNIKMVSFFTAELAIIHYHDGSSFELGLVPRWMKPPVEEVDYHTPREEYRLRHDAKEGISFFRESDLRNVPRSMSWAEVQKRYAQPVSFFPQPGTNRIVPSRVNMLTAPTLCRVLLDSEKKFVEQTQWVAEWGSEVAKAIPTPGGFVARGVRPGVAEATRATGRIASRQAAMRATKQLTEPVKQLTEQLDDLLKAGGVKDITVAGVKFEGVQLSRQGSRLAVRRFRIERVKAPPGQGSLVSESFEDAAASVARMNGLKTVTIDVGIITNPGWREWLEGLGYVFNQTEGAWIKTIQL